MRFVSLLRNVGNPECGYKLQDYVILQCVLYMFTAFRVDAILNFAVTDSHNEDEFWSPPRRVGSKSRWCCGGGFVMLVTITEPIHQQKAKFSPQRRDELTADPFMEANLLTSARVYEVPRGPSYTV